jgi:mannose-6-phosphate isomerase
MTANRLETRPIGKVWGRHDLPRIFGSASAAKGPVGEVWFEDPRGSESDLLVKYLLTSEKLSIQVHPGDEAARKLGYRSGKDEAWIVVAAEPGARIGLGLSEPISAEELRAAALDGRIEQLLDWREARPGDVHYSPAGTIHALGPGLTLVEVQQNVDLTYRLYDYGRPRELHLDEGIAAADLAPYASPFSPYELAPGREILVDCPAFVVERWSIPAGGRLAGVPGRPVWMIPLSGGGLIDGEAMQAPAVWIVEDQSRVRIDPASEILFAYPGGGVIKDLFVDTRAANVVGLGERRRYTPPIRLEPTFLAA